MALKRSNDRTGPQKHATNAATTAKAASDVALSCEVERGTRAQRRVSGGHRSAEMSCAEPFAGAWRDGGRGEREGGGVR